MKHFAAASLAILAAASIGAARPMATTDTVPSASETVSRFPANTEATDMPNTRPHS